jgi:hypothetical protein
MKHEICPICGGDVVDNYSVYNCSKCGLSIGIPNSRAEHVDHIHVRNQWDKLVALINDGLKWRLHAKS